MPNQIDQAYQKALEVLRACARPTGFYASGLPGGYEATWARDSMITSLGASLAGDEFQESFKKSLELLAANQTEKGLIPNCVGSYNEERGSDVTFNSIDAPQWFIIGHYVYAQAYRDMSLIEKYKKNIAKALIWLTYQDPNEDKIIVQQPTMDWMDAFPHKYGRVMHTQALQYAVYKMVGRDEQADEIKKLLNGDTRFNYLALYDKKLGYYLPWAWKDHDGERECEYWFDSIANVLAILTGLATPAIGKKIITHIKKEKINRPYALKAIWPPLEPSSLAWHSYFDKCDARTPNEYLNGGIWPFIGGFYIAALVKLGLIKEAQQELEILAKGLMKKCKDHEFNEWLHGQTGEALGEPYQGWSAGTYIYGYECVKKKKAIYFE